MQSLKSGDPLAPVTAVHVMGLKEVGGVIFRMEYVTRNDQPMDKADVTLNYTLKPALARKLAQHLLDAADGAEGKAPPPQAATPAA